MSRTDFWIQTPVVFAPNRGLSARLVARRERAQGARTGEGETRRSRAVSVDFDECISSGEWRFGSRRLRSVAGVGWSQRRIMNWGEYAVF